MINLDQAEQRILGVLLEKQRTVPDTYPMTENALVTGCNQSSNRDPVMSLKTFEVAGALMALHGSDVVLRVEGSSRAVKYRHRLDEILGASENQLAVLAELLLRGPQAAGALKPRVARMGFLGSAVEVEAVLHAMATCSPALVVQEPRRPRERDHRWRHLLGASCAEPSVPIDGDNIGNEVSRGSGSRAGLVDEADPVLQRLTSLERRLDALEQALGHGVPKSQSDDPPGHGRNA